jgi:tRNA dimethylallyltransferase
MSSNRKIIVVVGPTASGKSALAVAIAKKVGGEVVSADSRQVYRGMDIGTGKITKREMRGVPHHLLDVVSPRTRFSAERFQKKARKAFEIIWKKGKIPVLCGGTGFYIDAVIFGTKFPEVPPDESLRKKLKKLPPRKLFAMLQRIDSERAETIDPKNPHRLIRAIEIASALGKVPLVRKDPVPADIEWIGIRPDMEELKKKISVRLLKRIRGGMVNEIRKLHDSGVSWKRLESFGLEYKWGALYVQKKISKSDFIENLYADIVKYAKRQITWFKRNKEIQWIEIP